MIFKECYWMDIEYSDKSLDELVSGLVLYKIGYPRTKLYHTPETGAKFALNRTCVEMIEVSLSSATLLTQNVDTILHKNFNV